MKTLSGKITEGLTAKLARNAINKMEGGKINQADDIRPIKKILNQPTKQALDETDSPETYMNFGHFSPKHRQPMDYYVSPNYDGTEMTVREAENTIVSDED